MKDKPWRRWNYRRIAREGHGSYERSRNHGQTWEPCTRGDARAALGWMTTDELARLARTASSEWGVLYRYVPPSPESARAAG